MTKDHSYFLNTKHRLRCCNIFSEEESDFLTSYGEWLYALANKQIEPTTEAQKHFVEFSNNINMDPLNDYEKWWKKYQKRIEFEKHTRVFDGYEVTKNDLPDSSLGLSQTSHEPRF